MRVYQTASQLACQRTAPAFDEIFRHIEQHGLAQPGLIGTGNGACTDRVSALSQALRDVHDGLRARGTVGPQAMQPAASLFWLYALIAPADATRHAGKVVAQSIPSHPMYSRLQRAYAEYAQLARSARLPVIAEGATSLKPGARDRRVEALRRYFILTGDYDLSDRHAVPFGDIYDSSLQAALKRFQSRHGLEPDGTLGKETVKALNTPLSQRIRQLALTLERLRQMPRAQGDYIHVNLPGFRLTAYQKNKPALQMRVIVGERTNPTPEFTNQITQIVLNPTWTPTYRILRDEMLPKARSNPASLSGYRVTDRRTGQVVDPLAIDWSQMSANDVHVEQPAGRGNALGKVKFLMPKSDSIYLHDTARPQLFSQSFRALSHGCIRLEKPKELAKFVMALGRPDAASGLEKAYDTSASRSYQMSRPLPVLTTYFTAWVNEDGQPEFYPDIYGRDEQLYSELLTKVRQRSGRQFASR
jgi:murein L,D-transpeptidase YcbB/YkuD